MALNIKDPVTEQLAAEVAELALETKTRAVRVALQERRERLVGRSAQPNRRERLVRFLVDEAWPQIPIEVRGRPLSREEREEILGIGAEGV